MTFADLRDAPPGLLAAVLQLNAAHEAETGPLDEVALRALLAGAAVAWAATGPAGGLLGFLVAFGPGAAYASPNYRWFAARHADFLYVDRVIVAPEARGQGLARRFYAALEEEARRRGVPRLLAEVNREPPNPASDAFHAALGFREVGTARLGPAKTVRYLERLVAGGPGAAVPS